jgi:RNA polymerase sigma-70 factor, ECF subfamily
MDTSSEKRSQFAALFGQNQAQLFGYIYSLVRDLDDADDLFQQTSLVLWDKYDRFDPEKSFIAWACGVARFEVSNFLRSRNRNRLYFSDALGMMLIDAHEELVQEELEERRSALAECMKKLRSRDQQLLNDCYGQSTRIPEVARCWGRSTHSIHNSLRRIRRTLYECVNRPHARVQEEGV